MYLSWAAFTKIYYCFNFNLYYNVIFSYITQDNVSLAFFPKMSIKTPLFHLHSKSFMSKIRSRSFLSKQHFSSRMSNSEFVSYLLWRLIIFILTKKILKIINQYWPSFHNIYSNLHINFLILFVNYLINLKSNSFVIFHSIHTKKSFSPCPCLSIIIFNTNSTFIQYNYYPSRSLK